MDKSRKASENAKYYANNKDELKSAFKEQAERAQNLYARISEDAAYVGGKVEQVKKLVPEVKEVAMEAKGAVMETKDAVIESKEDVVSAVKEDNPSPSSSLTDDSSANNSSSSNTSSSNTNSLNQNRN